MSATPQSPAERSRFIREMVAWHEAIIQRYRYPHAVAWELREAMYEMVARWRFR